VSETKLLHHVHYCGIMLQEMDLNLEQRDLINVLNFFAKLLREQKSSGAHAPEPPAPEPSRAMKGRRIDARSRGSLSEPRL
jgi:hypothetical protein